MTRRLWRDGTDEISALDHAALTDFEREALPAAYHYAKRYDLSTPPDEEYRRTLVPARRSVRERLLGGLARDTPAGIPDPVTVNAEGASIAATIDEVPGARDVTLVDQLPDSDDAECLLVIPLPDAGASVVAPVLAHGAFDRFQFSGWAVICRQGRVEPLGTPEVVATLLEQQGAFSTVSDAERFRSEVGESVANLALAYLGRRVLWDTLDRTPRPTGQGSRPAADASAFFDRLVIGGHPIHPGAKLRRNMSPTESLSFAPEFTDSIQLRFVAVRNPHTLSVSADGISLTERLYSVFPGLAAAVDESLPAGHDREEYAVLPVHPWQFRHVVPDRYADACQSGRVVPISGYSRSATPLLSLRTVVPSSDETSLATPPHLKLAIGVQTTNAVRTLSPNVVADGPQLGRIVKQKCENESFERFGVRSEPAAACYYPPDGPHPDGDGYDAVRHLGALIRPHPATHPIVGDSERAVTAASVLSCPPPGEQSVLAALLDAYADNETTMDRGETVKQFLSSYLDAVVPGPLTLLVKHGIGLEAHLQNTAVVFDNGQPTGALVSDFGDVRLLEPRLDVSFDPYPGSDVCTRDPEAAREKLWYALFQNHLGELVARLTATEPISEADCWSLARQCCENVFDNLAADGSVPDDRVSADRDSLFAPKLGHKPLTAMRISGDGGEQPRTTVPNPLFEAED
ncbi:IucA/IucC family siderophore biosynthesis protein [Halogeometricum borinquense]|uniref:IucA/IucC family siderophore biosynthesis protein n=1 Tax=Halogeometricum borinquense TaxID=60847 RepID=A0A6C0UKP7_9EURY|nr:IucA/IucC family protein [Halogeometricum borinquense]QIB76082.1 IucA/IucC family siderophore biosynthesis protein [Halogeometricum borinquense]